MRALLFAALLAVGCAGAEPAARTPEPQTVALSPLALREEQVARLREYVRTVAGDPRHPLASEELADALADLAREYRAAAVEADPRAASIAPPKDARERTKVENEAEIDAPQAEQELSEESGAGRPARDEAALATLAPKARALLVEADRRAFEAIAFYGEAMFGRRRGSDIGRLYAARARLLDELGQHTAARSDWYSVIRAAKDPRDVTEAYLSFAALFGEKGRRNEMTTALERAADSAVKANDPKLVARVCAVAASAGVKIDACR